MTNLITLTIPNDDHIALRAFGKALEEMALAHGAEPVQLQTYCNVTMTDEQNETLRERLKEVFGAPRDDIAEQAGIDPAIADAYVQGCHDTEAQQVESLCLEKLHNLDPKTLSTNTFPQQWKEAASKAISDAVEQGALSDSTGTPWDERIHSTSKALNADGTWRLRRKPKDMDELEWSDYVSMIKADLQYPVECGGEEEQVDQEHYAAETVEGVNDIEPPVTPPGDDFHTDVGVATEQTVAGIPPLPVPPPVVVAPPVTEWDFPRLMTFLTERHGKIDVATVNMLLAQDGMSSVQELNVHPDKIGPFVARVKAHLGE